MTSHEISTKRKAIRRDALDGFDDEIPAVAVEESVKQATANAESTVVKTKKRIRKKNPNAKFPSLLSDPKPAEEKKKTIPLDDGVIEIIEGSRYKAYRSKMKLFFVFAALNVIFIVIIQTSPSIVVAIIFLIYIFLSALPKFVFGSLLGRCKPNLRKPPDPPEEVEGVRRWRLSAEMFQCPNCSGDCTGSNFCSTCGQDVFSEHPILLTACVTVHHEDWEGVNAGIRSFEMSELPFDSKFMQVVYIVDGRLDRTGRIDAQQLETTQFIVTRLNNLPLDQAAADDDGVIRFKDKDKDPVILEDGTAMYKGKFGQGSDFVVLLKKINKGKRDSHELFFNYMDRGLTQKTAKAIMFVDSDVEFAWKGNTNGLGELYRYLTRFDALGGACGEIEVAHWYRNPLTMTQFFEYKSNQFLAKTGENWFGMVTCLPGAFCMVRPQALEHVLNQYLAMSNTIWEKNQLDLGEDRTLTTLLLEKGWDTGYVPQAVARTDAPITVVGLIKQRRRWINSTIVNMMNLLQKVRRPATFPLLIALALELLSSFLLPTAVLQLFIQIGLDMGIHVGIVLGTIVLWGGLLITFALTTKLEKMEYFYHASIICGGGLMAVMLIYIFQDFSVFLDKYWIEVLVMLGWVGLVVLASVIHGQWMSVFNLAAPLVWMLLSPMMYVIIPVYAVCNFDDVSWGTRGS